MAISSSIPKIIAAGIVRGLEDRLIANRICNTQYLGEIKRQGDKVTFPGLGEPTVSTYTGNVAYETMTDTAVDLLINQAKYVAFKIEDKDMVQSAVDLRGSQAERAMYQLRRQVDKYVLGMYAEAGTTMEAATITAENVVPTLSLMAQKLEERNVDTEGMWIAVPPFVKKFLRDAGVMLQINNGQSGTGGLFWTNELGFDLYVSNNLAVVEGNTQVLGGSYSAIAYAGQITESETIRLSSIFGDAFRALFVYGAKVVKPDELICLPAKA